MATSVLNIAINSTKAVAGAQRVNKALNSIKRSVNTMGQGAIRGFRALQGTLLNLKTAILGAGIGLMAKSFIDVASTTESYQLRLKALLGSQAKANKLFQDMTKFAGKVPFEYREIMGAATQLAGVMEGGVEEVNKWMPMIADLAAVSGLIQKAIVNWVLPSSPGPSAISISPATPSKSTASLTCPV